MPKAKKRDRSSPNKSTGNSPILKAPRLPSEAMPEASTGGQVPDMATMMANFTQLTEKVKALEEQQAKDRQAVQFLKEENDDLKAKLRATEEECEKLRQAANRTRLVLWGAPPGTTKEAIKNSLAKEAAGVTVANILDAYESGPCWIVVVDSVATFLKLLSNRSSIRATLNWSLDRSTTRQQRALRKEQQGRYKELKEAGARPRFHGAQLMVKMSSGIKPAAEWNPALKLPPQPNGPAAGQQRRAPSPSYAAATAKGAPRTQGPRAAGPSNRA